MADMTVNGVKYADIKPKIGSRIFNSKAELLSGALASDLLSMLEERGVLVFPQVNLSDEEQKNFTNILGGTAKEIGGGDIFKVSLDSTVNEQAAEYLKGSLYWHIDGTMNRVPIRASMLTAKKLSPEGGETDFANTAAAYADLSDDKKAEIDGFRVVHSLWRSQLYHTPEPSLAQLENWFSKGEAELPLVCTHRSGRKSLVLGNTAHYIRGIDSKDSYRYLQGLREFATSEPYSYRHKWEIGDTIMWDNRTSLHRATPYDPASGRLMHRTILDGTEAWEE